MHWFRSVVLGALLIVLVFGPAYSAKADEKDSETIRIGVLARRGAVACLKEWSPTAHYLSERLPGVTFKIVPLNFREISPAVARKQVDFVITNPYIYAELQDLYGVSRMATLKRLTPNGHTSLFGGSIFCRADRTDISSIGDLKGQSFAAVDETSFGGWMVAWRELKTVGINPQRNLAKLTFGGTQDDVVFAVRDGKVDAGAVATPILAQMIEEGKISKNTFKILNSQEEANFFYGLSTRLYPEWPFSKLKHAQDEIAEKVAIALLAMPKQSSAAVSAEIAGWTVPFDYSEVQICMKELQVGIYREYGKVSLKQMFTVYSWQSFSVITAIIILVAMLLQALRLNKRLRITETSLLAEMQERRRSNEELAQANILVEQSRQELANIIDFLPDATFVVDKEKKVVIWNRAIEEMTRVSKEEMIGQGDNAYSMPFYGEKRKQLLDLLDFEEGDIKKSYQHVTRRGNVLYAEAFASSLYDNKGATIWATCAPLLDSFGNYVGAIESIRDISEQKQLEEERKKLQNHLQQAQKMETIGTLAGGIAHDFNNILTAILGYAEMAREDSPADAAVIHDIDQILKAGHRAKELVKQILAFSRQADADKIRIQPATVIKEALKLLRASLPTTIAIEQDIDSDVGVILADPTHLHQIMMNLCTNAFHAMEMAGGTLTVALARKEITPEDLSGVSPIHQGIFVQLSIKDTGVGIAPEIKNRIFDPFFTTKEVGKGTGMGLSMVHGIVRSYGGSIVCESVVGEGTVLHVTLPILEAEASRENDVIEQIPRGNERILLVDDEELLVEMTKSMLERLGYRVIAMRNSLEALTTFQNQPDAFDMIITDQTMPGMTGIDLARSILRIQPAQPIILCTGYSSIISEVDAKLLGIKGFAMKPLVKKELANLIRKILD